MEWLAGIFGVVTGDALGDPVQFESRRQVALHPVTCMRGGGAYSMPAGAWTDDGSMTLALLASICEKQGIDLDDICERFIDWNDNGAYTPFGEAFDQGGCTLASIERYKRTRDPKTCGGRSERDNGNGSLMRILPVCIYCARKEQKGEMSAEKAIEEIHAVSALTHAHARSKIGCGLYGFLVGTILEKKGSAPLSDILQEGMERGFSFYEERAEYRQELSHYDRLRDLSALKDTPSEEIRSSGYVVDTLEATVWALLQEETFEKTLLRAVNLGDDADTVGAVTGGLAGLYYGYESIPKEWLLVIPKREKIEVLCRQMEEETKA